MAATRAKRRPAQRSRPSSRNPRRRARRGRPTWARRAVVAVAVVAVGALGGALIGLTDPLDKAIKELTLPLRHEDIIRQQASEKEVDASLIAAVIYAESRFSDQTSSAGARGLMQITRGTADYIERRSGGTTFRFEDLADPDINIRYGTFYLRELLDRYEQNEAAALAAYNAGPGNADAWGGPEMDVEDIGFLETRAYVEDVLDKRQAYRDEYRRELGY